MDYSLSVAFGWEPISTMDNYFMIDKPESQRNGLSIQFFEKFDAQNMRQFMKDEVFQTLRRAKKQLVQRFGRWYYVPLTEAEFESRFDDLVEVVPKLKNEAEFEDLMRKLQDERMKVEGGTPIKCVLVEDSHIENRSIMIILIHHVFGDGIVWIGAINACAENGFEDLAKFRMQLGFNPLLELAGMFYGIIGFFQILMNLDLSKKQQPDPKREYVLSKEFDMKQMKAACKSMKAPFQASFFSILSTSMAEFNKRRAIKDTKMNVASAFSLAPLITKREEMRNHNMIVQTTSELQITDDMHTAIKKAPKPDIFAAFGSFYKAMLLTSLPFDLGRFLLEKTRPTKPAWFAYSQIPIAMNHLVVNGSKMTSYTGMLRPGNKGHCGICAGTIGNVMQYGMVSDKE